MISLQSGGYDKPILGQPERGAGIECELGLRGGRFDADSRRWYNLGLYNSIAIALGVPIYADLIADFYFVQLIKRTPGIGIGEAMSYYHRVTTFVWCTGVGEAPGAITQGTQIRAFVDGLAEQH